MNIATQVPANVPGLYTRKKKKRHDEKSSDTSQIICFDSIQITITISHSYLGCVSTKTSSMSEEGYV